MPTLKLLAFFVRALDSEMEFYYFSHKFWVKKRSSFLLNPIQVRSTDIAFFLFFIAQTKVFD